MGIDKNPQVIAQKVYILTLPSENVIWRQTLIVNHKRQLPPRQRHQPINVQIKASHTFLIKGIVLCTSCALTDHRLSTGVRPEPCLTRRNSCVRTNPPLYALWGWTLQGLLPMWGNFTWMMSTVMRMPILMKNSVLLNFSGTEETYFLTDWDIFKINDQSKCQALNMWIKICWYSPSSQDKLMCV